MRETPHSELCEIKTYGIPHKNNYKPTYENDEEKTLSIVLAVYLGLSVLLISRTFIQYMIQYGYTPITTSTGIFVTSFFMENVFPKELNKKVSLILSAGLIVFVFLFFAHTEILLTFLLSVWCVELVWTFHL